MLQKSINLYWNNQDPKKFSPHDGFSIGNLFTIVGGPLPAERGIKCVFFLGPFYNKVYVIYTYNFQKTKSFWVEIGEGCQT